MSRICGAVTRLNLIVGGAAFIAVAVGGTGLLAGCSDRSAKETGSTSRETRGVGSIEASTAAGPPWTAAKAVRHARRSTLAVAGRRVKIDPTTVVCWGVGRSERRGGRRVWRRFNCIAPTFRGAHAGPDVLFELRPTSAATWSILKARFSSYGPSATG